MTNREIERDGEMEESREVVGRQVLEMGRKGKREGWREGKQEGNGQYLILCCVTIVQKLRRLRSATDYLVVNDCSGR